jgi:hypothetical protein
MFCSKCGGNVSDGTQFCSKCGTGVSVGGGAAAAPARIAKPERRGIRASYVVMLLIVVGLGGWYEISQLRREAVHQISQSRSVSSVQMHKMTFGAGALTVAQGHRTYYKMTVPAEASNVKLQGHFAATGGSGNDIIVSVMTEDAFINGRNGHGHDALWETDDKVTVGDLDVTLPNGAGVYYLIFDNSFSLLSPKAVQQNIGLTYNGRV